ncbi:unnamed protein product [Allacma fusca]|uniref:Kaptin n=1 Tax=Allacma fusca TaxID=39272 RepID=A0A8J2PPR7_9HEXA|nr:unnamed protein product [Allacma fusca]
MREEQFIELPSQGSIYSVARLGNTVLVGSGDHGKLYSYTAKGSLEEVSLTDLPNDIEIVAVDAFQDPYPVLAITFVQKPTSEVEDKPRTAGLHIYSTWTEPDSPSYTTVSSPESFQKGYSPNSNLKDVIDSSLLELIGQQSKTFRLDYIPYDLCHVPVKMDKDSYEHIFLLTGSDRKVHTFQADNINATFSEVSTDLFFPEMSKVFDSVVTRVQVESLNETVRRISLCGCEDGTLHVWIVSSPQPFKNGTNGAQIKGGDGDTEVIEKIEHHFDGMITSIQFYTDGFQFNVVVASACSPTYIYTNTIEDRFSKGVPLKFSSRWDTVEAVCVADIDLDGRAEIIVGTFGCTMLVYKYMDDVMPQWVIVAHKKFSSGILSIDFVNFSLHVITSGGIHVIEYSTSAYFHKYSSLLSGTIPEETARASSESLTYKTENE